MRLRKTLYGLLACVSILFILYALVDNYVIDPGAERFVAQKTGLKRELNLPVWLTVMHVHVATACTALAAGLLNFSHRIFEKSRTFHRMNGYVYFVSVFVVVLTSGYMAPYATGGKISSIGFNTLNILWLFITIMAFVQIKKKRIIQHRNWMIRSYAFCFTNLVIHGIRLLLQGFGLVYATSYTIGVYGSIALLLVIPEIIIRSIGQFREVDKERLIQQK
ncbi:DUF2306 domain-containing protein [Brevibacillus humidisoli]|uniref:DUF2306 domain-containing protein n=1 Tax=Brevibacillus humidisoli TaxID=2895522 RepID=UPI001E486D3C|nr:DUF2306 domain-containing protein [Brevibacillus humidisoli]UFJ39459.1 DUF2306 domain-containing protein [Brevibacillus humidisoli]